MDASILRIMALCISAALVCASLRTAHPQIASAVALASGIAALMLSLDNLGNFGRILKQLDAYASGDGKNTLLRICGIALIAEFASDICRDAGETALARRIDAGVKIGITASALPTAAEIMAQIAELMK